MSDEIDLDDDLGLDDLDLGADFGGDASDMSEPVADDRKPITKVSESFIEGVRENTLSPQIINQTIRSSLPKGYSEALNTADEAVTLGNDLYNKAGQIMRPAIIDFKKAAKRLTPKIEGLLPESVNERLNRVLATPETVASAEIDGDQAAIDNSIAAIFTAQQEGEQKRSENDLTKDLLLDQKAEGRHQQAVAKAASTESLLSRIVGYQDSVLSNFQKTSLELQYRQYFAARDLLNLSTNTFADVVNNLKVISKNTALPEVQKELLSESYQSLMRDRLLGAVTDNVSDFTSGYMGKLKENITNKVTEQAQSFADGLSQFADMANMMADQDEQMAEMGVASEQFDPTKSGSKLFGGMVGGRIARFLGKRLNKTLESNDKVASTSNRLAATLGDLGGNLNRLATDGYQGDSETLQRIFEAIRPILPALSGERESITHNLHATSTEGVSYDQITRRSIIEIIPGYLSRILNELEQTRTGEARERLVYSTQREEFVRIDKAAEDAKQYVLSKSTKENLGEGLDRMMRIIDPEDKLTLEARRVLSRQLLKDLDRAVTFDPVKMAMTDYFPTQVSEEVKGEIKNHLKEVFRIDDNGAMKNKRGNTNRLRKASSQFVSLRSDLPNQQEQLNRFNAVGSKELLREAGLIKKVDNSLEDSFEFDKYFDRLEDASMTAFGRRLAEDEVDFKDDPEPPPSDNTPPAGTPPNTPPNTPPTPNGDNHHSVLVDLPKQTQLGSNQVGSVSPAAMVNSIVNPVSPITPTTQAMPVAEVNQPVVEKTTSEKVIELKELTTEIIKERESAEQLGAAVNILDQIKCTLDNIEVQVVGSDVGGVYTTHESSANHLMTDSTLTIDKAEIHLAEQDFDGIPNTDNPVNIRDLLHAMNDAIQQGVDLKEDLPVVSDDPITATDTREYRSESLTHLESLERIMSDGSQVVQVAGLEDMVGNDSHFNTKSSIFARLRKRIENGFNRLLGKDEDLETNDKESRSLAGKLKGIVSGYMNIAMKPYKSLANVPNAIGSFFGSIEKDVYVKGEDKPRLTVATLKGKGYYDAETLERLETLKEIKSPIVDVDGNFVLTEADITQGLITRDGVLVKLTGLAGKVFNFTKGFAGNYINGVKGYFNLLKGAGSRVKDFAGNLKSYVDIYIPGEASPKLLGSIMKQGGYISAATGKVIRSAKDIDGDVKDLQGRVVLTLEEARTGLMDHTGKKIDVRHLAKKALDWGWDKAKKLAGAAKDFSKTYFNKTKDIYKGGIDLLRNKLLPKVPIVGKYFNSKDDESIEQNDKVVQVLNRIYKLLDKRLEKPEKAVLGDLDGDGFRDGGWQAQLKKRKEELAGAATVGATKAKQTAKDKKSQLKGWLDQRKERANDNDDDDVGILETLAAFAGISDLFSGGKSVLGKLFSGGKSLVKRGAGLGASLLAGKTLGGVAATTAATGAGAATVASGAASAGGGLLAAKLAAGAGSVLGGLFSLPALGVGAAMVGGYYGIKYLARRSGVEPLERYRFAQYGVDVTDTDQLVAIRYLEEEVIDHIEYKDGRAQITLSLQEAAEEYAVDFGVDLTDTVSLRNWVIWFRERFAPVFTTHLSFLNSVDSDVDLLDVDDELDDKFKPEMIKATAFAKNGSGPYSVTASPWPNKPLISGIGHIEQAANEVGGVSEKAPLPKALAKNLNVRRPESISPVPAQPKQTVQHTPTTGTATKQVSMSDMGIVEANGDGGQQVRLPLKGIVTSNYGMRIHPILGHKKMHHGIDIAAPEGEPVYAAMDGVVRVAGYGSGYGNVVYLEHKDGTATRYAHLSRFKEGLEVGSKVAMGDPVGYVGSTGRSTGPHLHFEVRRSIDSGSDSIDPVAKIPQLAALRNVAKNKPTTTSAKAIPNLSQDKPSDMGMGGLMGPVARIDPMPTPRAKSVLGKGGMGDLVDQIKQDELRKQVIHDAQKNHDRDRLLNQITQVDTILRESLITQQSIDGTLKEIKGSIDNLAVTTEGSAGKEVKMVENTTEVVQPVMIEQNTTVSVKAPITMSKRLPR
ncbi:peptidoglycan DD-metalloendopeptidase family protein [Endozoicomonas sp. ONNA1]|uniref:M23 family metallopeptidase n=1 Tax=Endozoicomonas sp. ONNA1 TaxID=2828740 RepID=UPI0021481B99|nr:peptidoglycan DD-metalloendopeptidase family protein [Endozoicomonas sp. ONNA1]